MATALVSTPLRKHSNAFSSKVAGGRLDLTPSPKMRVAAGISNSPNTPLRAFDDEPLYVSGFYSRLQRSAARTSVRDSPKSNIVKATQSPRRVEAPTSEFTLTGTGAHNKHTPAKSRKDINIRARPTKSTVRANYHTLDRFIPNRGASEGLTTGAAKLDVEARPRSSRTEGSNVLANAATIFDVGGRASADDLVAALEHLDIDEEDEDAPTQAKTTPRTLAYQASLASACGVSLNTRILAFKPVPPESSRPVDLRAQYNRPLKPAHATSAQFRRRIPSAPERVLDAPGLEDDYYLNLLDWSSGNQVAIGLERSVYVWSAETGEVNSLLECDESTKITSVKWSNDGHYVGVGLGTGEVQIWDVEEGSKLRSMAGHDTRVGVLGWNKHVLSTGSRSGLVLNHDVRIAQHKIAELVSHDSEVCGLEWRADGAQLATGGNDNLVSIWDARCLVAPKFTKTNHRAAVKALSWCPWQSNLLATGGGAHDRHIHFWNTTTGARVNSIDTGSQVTGLRWSAHHKEIASTGGFPDNSVSVWSYPTLVRNAEIPAHDSRVLHSCLSPDGQVLATAAADESLKFWKVFEKKAGAAGVAAPGAATTGAKASLSKQMTIR